MTNQINQEAMQRLNYNGIEDLEHINLALVKSRYNKLKKSLVKRLEIEDDEDIVEELEIEVEELTNAYMIIKELIESKSSKEMNSLSFDDNDSKSFKKSKDNKSETNIENETEDNTDQSSSPYYKIHPRQLTNEVKYVDTNFTLAFVKGEKIQEGTAKFLSPSGKEYSVFFNKDLISNITENKHKSLNIAFTDNGKLSLAFVRIEHLAKRI